LPVAWEIQKALVRAIETVRDYSPKLKRNVFCCVDGHEGSGVGDKEMQEGGAHSFERRLDFQWSMEKALKWHLETIRVYGPN
jgi:hypothetical protein